MKIRFILSCLLSAMFLAVPLVGAPDAPKARVERVEMTPVQATLHSEVSAIKPGEKFWVGVELKMEEGWDTYWINPGDAGMPTNVQWKLPEGFQVSSLHWPYPERIENSSMVGFGYTHAVMLLAEVTPPANLASGTSVDLHADVQWLACKDQCMPGKAEVKLSLPVQGAAALDKEKTTLFAQARERLPAPQGDVQASVNKGEIILNFKPGFTEVAEALFVPEKGEVIDYGAPQKLMKEKEGYFLNLKRPSTQNEGAPPSEMKGVLIVAEKGSLSKKAFQIDTPITAHKSAASHFLIALVCAFAGGIILNVMPCVLPVVALKIFSFVKMAGENRREILKQGGLFAAGVIVSFWILAALLLVLRAMGQGIGWGFQLQEPIFVAVLLIVLFLLALSLLGVFEFGTSLMGMGEKVSSKGGIFKGSFMSGVLATLVATPCTGPLLGPALGLAVTLPAAGALTIFTAMGLGMAAPYLIFAAFPKLIRFLPKPGNWMVIFKQLLGFLMLATCVWLIWVFGGQTTHLSLLILLFALLIIGLAAWVYGRFATYSAPKMARRIATGVAVVILTLGGTLALSAAKYAAPSTAIEQVSAGEWQSFSMDKVNALRAEGKSVFVDFTAKWCLICQANKMTLHSADIQKAFGDRNIVPLEADWTKRDSTIGEVLHNLGRSGVPVYVIYPADTSKAPIILPQTLTKATVNEYLAKLDH